MIIGAFSGFGHFDGLDSITFACPVTVA